MHDDDDDLRIKLARALIWGAPLSIALWAALALALIAMTPHTVRHEIRSDARYAAHALKSRLGWRTPGAAAGRAG